MRLHALIVLAVALLLPCPCALGAVNADPASEPKPPTLHGEPLPEPDQAADEDKPPMFWRKPLPKPDLATLAKRAGEVDPRSSGGDPDLQVFLELIYLRERPDPEAFPVLKQILQQRSSNQQVEIYATLQALYTLGSKESLALLDKTMNGPEMCGYTQTFLYSIRNLGMDPQQSAGLIEHYCLKNLSKDLVIQLKVDDKGDRKADTILLDATITNNSDNTLGRPDLYSMSPTPELVLRDKAGRYYLLDSLIIPGIPKSKTERIQSPPASIQIKPGGKQTIRIPLTVKQEKNGLRVLVGDSQYFDLPEPGEYEVFYWLERSHQPEAPGGKDRVERWAVRAVSKPIKITLGQVPANDNPKRNANNEADAGPALAGKPLPEPDLDTLATRCHPDTPPAEAGTAFEELIYLRERPDPAALAVLKQVLEQSGPEKSTHAFAALQALYTLNTEASLALLEETMASPAMFGQTLELIRYTLEWEMDPKQAAGLIEGYCLKNSGKDIILSLGLDAQTAKGGRVGIDVYFTNTTKRNLVWYDEQALVYFPRGLLLRDKQGRYYAPYKTLAKDGIDHVPTQTGPGKKTISRRIVMSFHKKPDDDKVVWVLTRNMAFDLPAPGEYEAVFMFESPPMNERQRAAWSDKTAAYWSGRVVSEPITITVPEGKSPERPPKPSGAPGGF